MIIVAKDRKKERKRLQLVRGWSLVIEVSHQGDTNRFFVHVIGFTVGAVLLPDPPWRHFDLPVPFPQSSIIDQEMIPEAIPETALPVRALYRSGISLSGGCVVQDDVPPLGVPVEVYDVTYHSGVGDDEFAANQQRIAGFEPVCRIY